MADVFSVPIFFVVFRETLECSIIIAVLCSFIHKTVPDDKKLRRRLYRQVWIGTGVGLFVCLCIGAALVGVWYRFGNDIWGGAEDLWEGIFSLIACALITIVGVAMLRINKMHEKWTRKLAHVMEKNQAKGWKDKSRKYSMLILPLITTLREGVEAIVFIFGVSIVGVPATAYPLPVILGLAAGALVGYILYRSGNLMSIQILLIASTCFLYLISAGLFSKAVWDFEMYQFSQLVGGDVAETGSGPGSYDVRTSVWHVDCCNGETDGGWMVFNALFGWQNSATIGSVVSYCMYWLFVIAMFAVMGWRERRGKRALVDLPAGEQEFRDEVAEKQPQPNAEQASSSPVSTQSPTGDEAIEEAPSHPSQALIDHA